MGTTVEIPGGTAVVRGPGELRVRHRRIVESAAVAAADVVGKLDPGDETLPGDLSPAEAAKLLALQDATIVACLESWTLPEPLPTLDTVGDLQIGVYDALARATREAGAEAALRGTDFGPRPLSEDSPTVPSGSSNGNLVATAEPQPAPKPEPAGESSPTAPSTPA
ncbi:MAG: hypothetical protein ACP5PW_01495 [Candidatus Dormibacteria bacterium]